MLPTPRRVVTVVAAVLALSTAGCAPGDPDVDSLAATQGLPDLKVDISAREWLLDPDATTVAVGDDPITLDFHPDDTASGIAPCNTYRAAVSIGEDTVTFTDVRTTLVSCDREVMGNEDAYLAALMEVHEVDLTDRDRLILSGPDGLRLEFTEFRAYEAIVDTWKVVNIATDDALSTPPAGVDPHLTFEDGDTVVVDAGCGPRSGTWALDDDSLTVTDLSPSDSCARPEAAPVEAAIIAALSGTSSAQIGPTTLSLLDPDETIALVAVTPDA